MLNASKTAVAPPSNSKSTFVQMRRMRLERSFAGDKFSVHTERFLRPDLSQPLVRPASMPSVGGGGALGRRGSFSSSLGDAEEAAGTSRWGIF